MENGSAFHGTFCATFGVVRYWTAVSLPVLLPGFMSSGPPLSTAAGPLFPASRPHQEILYDLPFDSLARNPHLSSQRAELIAVTEEYNIAYN